MIVVCRRPKFNSSRLPFLVGMPCPRHLADTEKQRQSGVVKPGVEEKVQTEKPREEERSKAIPRRIIRRRTYRDRNALSRHFRS